MKDRMRSSVGAKSLEPIRKRRKTGEGGGSSRRWVRKWRRGWKGRRTGEGGGSSKRWVRKWRRGWKGRRREKGKGRSNKGEMG